MNFKKSKKLIEEYWKAHEIETPYGADNLLFKDLEECRSPLTRQAYVDMLDMLLAEFNTLISKNRPGCVYHYALMINDKYSLDLSFGLMTTPLSFCVHSIIDNRQARVSSEEWKGMIKKIKEKGFDVSQSGKYNKYISFKNEEEFNQTWDWAWMEVLELYKDLIIVINKL